MKKIYFTKPIFLLLVGILISGMAFGDDYPKLIADFKKVKLEIGETYTLPDSLLYVESDTSKQIKVQVSWTVEPDSLGTISTLVFTAEKPGEGYLYAAYDTTNIDIELEIEAPEEEDDDDDDEFPKFLLDFDEVELDTGEIYQLPGMVKYWEHKDSVKTEVEVVWTVEPDSLGSLDEFNVFTAQKAGKGYLYLSYETLRDSVELEIEAEDDDDDEKDDDEMEYPKVKVIPGSVKVELGDSLELYAFYVDSTDTKKDTTFMWSVSPEELGSFPDPEIPMFKSGELGKGYIIATLGELSDSIKVEVYKGKWKKNNGNKGKQLSIVPGDTIVTTNAGMIQYAAVLASNGNKKNEGQSVEWSVSDTTIATIDQNGLLMLKGFPGVILVSAEYKNFKKSVELLIVDPSADLEINTITIHRVLPNGKELKPKVFNEGESYKITGLPYPLNILNAGRLHFPFGCISENITIYMRIPEEYASMVDDSTDVAFSDEIITGVQFDVQPEGSDTIVHPYAFNVPLELKLIFKRELLDSLGIDPLDIDVFFADNAEFIQVGEGMAMVDSAANRIYASIAHFSTIVVRQAEAITAIDKEGLDSKEVLDVYPNPLNTSTTIEFTLTEPGDVQIEVYNLFGQKVKLFTNRNYEKGVHKITWAADDMNGSPVTSGIYLCQFIKDGKVARVKKMVVKR